MHTQLIIFWVLLIVVGLAVDIGVYLFLRREWRKNGIVHTDVWLNRFFDRLGQIGKWVQGRIAASLVQYYREGAPALKPAPAVAVATDPQLDSEPVVDAEPVEIIPISVENVGQMRHIEFSLDLRLDSQVDVRIGATNEAGVTIQKREL